MPTTPTPAAPVVPPRAQGEGETGPILMWPVAGSAALVVLLGAALVVVRRKRRLPPPPIPDTPTELLAYARALAIEAARCDMVALQRAGGSRKMTDTVDPQVTTPAAAQVGHPTGRSYADIGERVAGVLSAAEVAADQIRDDARKEADGIVAVARVEADEARSRADAYDTETRTVVDAYASERRREAEQQVQLQLADVDAQARATRQAAEAMARQIEEAGLKRGQALRDESKVVEERLKKALAGLRRMVTELEELIGAPEHESLTDALRPGIPRADVAPATTTHRDPV